MVAERVCPAVVEEIPIRADVQKVARAVEKAGVRAKEQAAKDKV